MSVSYTYCIHTHINCRLTFPLIASFMRKCNIDSVYSRDIFNTYVRFHDYNL